MNLRRTSAALTSAAALTVTGIAMAQPATAAPNNTDQRGLVNLDVTDVNVQAPVSVAAVICGLDVNVLAQQLGAGAPVDCDAEGVATAERGGDGANNTRQRGLVNVAVTDANIQVPISAAVTVCGVSVNVLSTLPLLDGPVDCEAISEAVATG